MWSLSPPALFETARQLDDFGFVIIDGLLGREAAAAIADEARTRLNATGDAGGGRVDTPESAGSLPRFFFLLRIEQAPPPRPKRTWQSRRVGFARAATHLAPPHKQLRSTPTT